MSSSGKQMKQMKQMKKITKQTTKKVVKDDLVKDYYEFKNIADISEYINMTDTNRANVFAEEIKQYVKMVDGPKEIYFFFDIKTKLWQKINRDGFRIFVFNYYNKTAQHVKDMIGDLKDSRINKLVSHFDSDIFINRMIDRSKGYLYDRDLFIKLNNSKNGDFLPLRDGKKINLKTLEITERTKDDYYTFELDVSYVNQYSDAEKYFKNLFEDDDMYNYMQNRLGYMITNNMDSQEFYLFHGNGNNGKSLLVQILEKILKQFYIPGTDAIFKETSKSGNAEGPSPFTMKLIGPRLCIYSEGSTSDKMVLNETQIKKITGEDSMTARGLRQEPVDFKSKCKLAMMSNHIFSISGEYSFKRRLKIIPFNKQFQRNDKYKEFLLNSCLDQIFTWLCIGAKKYYENPTIETPKMISEYIENAVETEDSIISFYKRCVTITKSQKDKITYKDFFEKYKEFCDNNSQRCQVRSLFYTRMKQDYKLQSGPKLHGYDQFIYVKCSLPDEKEQEEDISKDIYDETPVLLKDAYKKIHEQASEIEKLKAELAALKGNQIIKQKEEEQKQEDEEEEEVVKVIKTKKTGMKGRNKHYNKDLQTRENNIEHFTKLLFNN
jgi:P4 family phage/plasmid primase-like protien